MTDKGCLKTDYETIDDKIDEWHKGNSNKPLYEFLGITFEEYKKFVEEGFLPDTECPTGCMCEDTRTCECFWDCVEEEQRKKEK